MTIISNTARRWTAVGTRKLWEDRRKRTETTTSKLGSGCKTGCS